MAVDDPLGSAVIDDDRQLDEMLEAGELRAVDAAVQEDAVERVDRVLALLQPVAGRMDRIGHEIVARHLHAIEDREIRLDLGRAHVSKDQSLELVHRVGALADLMPDVTFRLAGRLEDGAVSVEVPAVIAADDAVLRDTSELQGSAAMGAMLVQDADLAGKVAEDDEILAEDADGHRVLLALDLLRHGDGVPEAAHVLAARRSRPDMS